MVLRRFLNLGIEVEVIDGLTSDKISAQQFMGKISFWFGVID